MAEAWAMYEFFTGEEHNHLALWATISFGLVTFRASVSDKWDSHIAKYLAAGYLAYTVFTMWALWINGILKNASVDMLKQAELGNPVVHRLTHSVWWVACIGLPVVSVFVSWVITRKLTVSKDPASQAM